MKELLKNKKVMVSLACVAVAVVSAVVVYKKSRLPELEDGISLDMSYPTE